MTLPHASTLPADEGTRVPRAVPAALTDAMTVLAVDALVSLNAQVDAVEALAVRALHAPVPADDDERVEALHCAHRVAGTAGAFAWHDASTLLREAEGLLEGEGDLDIDGAVRLCELVVEAREDLARPAFTTAAGSGQTAPGPRDPGTSPAPEGPRIPSARPVTPVRPSTVDVVVVEDDLILASLICRVVTDLGLSVAHCEDGVSALGLLAGSDPPARPRMVLLDIDLPGRSGLSVLRVLQRDDVTAYASVIMLSSRSGAEDRELAAQLGARSFLSKPFAIRDLVARLQGLVEAAVPC